MSFHSNTIGLRFCLVSFKKSILVGGRFGEGGGGSVKSVQRTFCTKKSICESSIQSIIIVRNFDCIKSESQQKLFHIPVEISGVLLETTGISMENHWDSSGFPAENR